MTHLNPSIFDFSLSSLQEFLKSYNQPSFRAIQVWQGLYQQLWNSPAEFSTLPANLKETLADQVIFDSLTPIKTLYSKDKRTVKTLFGLQDGNAVESVWMQYEDRNTLCISTQAGCAMGCKFCATGQIGFKRNLSSGEIVEQVLYFARIIREKEQHITNIVIMGMGEPFLNYEATMDSIDRLNHPQGCNLGERRFTISTVGIIPMIHRFSAEHRQVNLAISLHAATDEIRSKLIPINNQYPIHELLTACKEYITLTGRRVSFEWAMIQNINDSQEQARILVSLIKNLTCHVNIIPLNPTINFSGAESNRQRIADFQNILVAAGIPCTIRLRRGVDIQAGCGQLASLVSKPE